MKDMDFVYDLEDFDGRVVEEPARGPVGIGGWLLFPTIGWIGYNAVSLLLLMVRSNDQLERLGCLIMFALLCIPSTLLVRRSRHFPKAWIATFWTIIILALIGAETTHETEEVARIAVYAALWTWYLLVSKRVKNTFTK